MRYLIASCMIVLTLTLKDVTNVHRMIDAGSTRFLDWQKRFDSDCFEVETSDSVTFLFDSVLVQDYVIKGNKVLGIKNRCDFDVFILVSKGDVIQVSMIEEYLNGQKISRGYPDYFGELKFFRIPKGSKKVVYYNLVNSGKGLTYNLDLKVYESPSMEASYHMERVELKMLLVYGGY